MGYKPCWRNSGCLVPIYRTTRRWSHRPTRRVKSMSTITKKYLGLILFCGVAVSEVFALVGSDNPDGPAGELDRSGTITTGGNISPYTANASRSVTDLVVSGGVGAYPLAFTRISNSRSYLVNDNSVGATGQNADFGTGGNLLHSYQW